MDGRVAAWFLKNWPRNVALEVKVDNGSLLPHQKAALKQVLEGKFLYKIPDMGKRNPFDYVVLPDADAVYCVVVGKKATCTVNGNIELEFGV